MKAAQNMINKKEDTWKMFAGKEDCWGNVNHYIIHHKDDYWNRRVVHGTFTEARTQLDLMNMGVVVKGDSDYLLQA